MFEAGIYIRGGPKISNIEVLESRMTVPSFLLSQRFTHCSRILISSFTFVDANTQYQCIVASHSHPLFQLNYQELVADTSGMNHQ